MVEQGNTPSESMMIASVFIGIIVGFIASVLLCVSIFLGSNLSYWLILPVYAISGIMATIVVLLLFSLRRPTVPLEGGSRFSDDPGPVTHIRRGSFLAHAFDTGFDRSETVDYIGNTSRNDNYSTFDMHASKKGAVSADGSSLTRTLVRPQVRGAIRSGQNDRIGPSPPRQVSQKERRASQWTNSLCAAGSVVSEEINAEEAPMLPLSENLIDRLFGRVVDLRPESEFGRDGIVGYFGEPTSGSLSAITRWAGPQRGLVFASSLEEVRWPEVQAIASLAQVCFIDADYMGDLEATIDFCVRLRNGARETPLVLISSEVRGHDLTAERCMICDATLMPPLSERIIQIGVSAAQENFSRSSSAAFGSS